MENFEGIIEFTTVAECGGFSAAAKKLGVSTSHVSRQIARLEGRLKCSLLSRTTRLVSLTGPGLLYYQHCKTVINVIKQANEEVSAEQVKLTGTLRVSSGGSFSERYVAPALIEFAKLHPDLDVEMDFSAKNVNFIEDEIDFSIRYGQLKDSSLVARKLADRSFMAVASREYLDKFGTPQTPQDLKDHSCIIVNKDIWKFREGDRALDVKVSGRWKSNNLPAVIAACEKGLGISYMPKSSFLDSLAKKTLVPILQSFWSSDSSSWIVYQPKKIPTSSCKIGDRLSIGLFQRLERIAFTAS